MKRILFLITFLLAIPTFAQRNGEAKETDTNILKAALKGWHVSIGAGFNIGGTSPLPLPKEIRSIDSYRPTISISVEGATQKMFDAHWGLRTGIRLENRGMKTDATVKNYHMEAVNVDGSGTVIGAWTGHVKTEVNNNYLTIPLLAVYQFNDRWQVQGGPYIAWMFNGSFTGEAYDGYIRDQDPTGEKAQVTRATYDFSDDLRHFHWGLQVGGQWKAYKHLAVTANLQWGLNGIFPNDFGSVTFALYPIYANIGFSYLF